MDENGTIHERKPGGGFWVTGKQAAVAGITAGAISLPQILNWKELLTGEQARRQDRMEIALTTIASEVKDLSKESAKKVDRADMKEEVADAERRCEARTLELRADLSALQIFAFKTIKPKGS